MPRVRVPRLTAAGSLESVSWERALSLPSFVRADGSGAPVQPTHARVAWDGERLFVRFDCRDEEIWWTHTRRDAALWEEEVVEIFLAAGAEDPARYFEFEVNPGGVLFDAVVENPDGIRATLRADTSWDCRGLLWAAEADPAAGRWIAYLGIPLRELTGSRSIPTVWRANLFRVDRPRGGAPEFTAWSPPLTEPADFHKPSRFGRIELEG